MSNRVNVYSFHEGFVAYAFDIEMEAEVLRSMQALTDGKELWNACGTTVQRLVKEFNNSTISSVHSTLSEFLNSASAYNFPRISSFGKIAFAVTGSIATSYVILMGVTSTMYFNVNVGGTTYNVKGDRVLRDTNDPFPLIFADCFQKLWKQSNAVGLTTPSMNIETVCSIISNLAFGGETSPNKESPESVNTSSKAMHGDTHGAKPPHTNMADANVKDRNVDLDQGCVSANPIQRTKPTQIKVDRHTLGDAILKSYKLRGKDSWCSVADDVINHLLP